MGSLAQDWVCKSFIIKFYFKCILLLYVLLSAEEICVHFPCCVYYCQLKRFVCVFENTSYNIWSFTNCNQHTGFAIIVSNCNTALCVYIQWLMFSNISLSSAIPAALPYIGAYLDQIYSLEMCTKTCNKDGLVNFTKMTKVRVQITHIYICTKNISDSL